MSFASQATQQKFPFPYDAVIQGLASVLPHIGLKVKSVDPVIGRISASAGMSLFSWGENVTIVIERVEDNVTLVAMESALKVGFNAGGAHRHAKNFNKIIEALSRYLQQSASDSRAA